MSTVVSELFDTRRDTIENGVVQASSVQYVVSGVADENAVRIAILDEAPGYYGGVPRKRITIDEQVNNTVWRATVEYEWSDSKTAPAPGDPAQLWDFDTTGGTQHITQSIATIAGYAPAGLKVPDNQGAIGFNGEKIEGVDIVVPVFQFSVVKVMTTAAVTNAYIQTLFQLTGCVNSTPFIGMFAPGEVLFLGANGAQKDGATWSLTYRFGASPNRTGLTIGAPVVPGTGTYGTDPGTGTPGGGGTNTGTGPILPGTSTGPHGGIMGIAKKGWDYLWIKYFKNVDALTGDTLVEIPRAVYVEQVYQYADFGLLGL